MSHLKFPVTPAVRLLRSKGIDFVPHLYPYQDKGGTAHSSAELGVDEHAVIKTLVMEDDRQNPLIILMHGDRQVSTKELARTIGAKSVAPAPPERADRYSGYQVGGTSPFGTRREMPVYLEETILTLGRIYINGGKRGFLVEIAPVDLERALRPVPVKVAI